MKKKQKSPASPKEERHLVKTVKVTLVKPLGDWTWDEAGQRLRDLNGVMHRLLNRGIRACAVADYQGQDTLQASRDGVNAEIEDIRGYWRERIGKPHEGENHDPGRAARFAEFALPSSIKDHVQTRAAKAFADARKHMMSGAKSIPSFKQGAPIFMRDGSWELVREPKGYTLQLKIFPAGAKPVVFAIRVHGPGAFADLRKMTDESLLAVGAELSRLNGQEKNALKQIPKDNQDARAQVRAEFVARRAALSNWVKLGDCRIVRNERDRSWEARLCYSFPKPPPAHGEEVLAVHRGMHQFLTIADTTGGVCAIDGTAWLLAKQRFSARRSQIGRHHRNGSLSPGARGHGKWRRDKAKRSPDESERLMMTTACQQAAARVVAIAIKIGAGKVLVEDYQTISKEDDTHTGTGGRFMPTWPWAQLKTAVEWACKKGRITCQGGGHGGESGESGAPTTAPGTRSKPRAVPKRPVVETYGAIAVQEVPAAYISMTCPNAECRHVSADNVRDRMFECAECGLRRNVDTVAAWNMLYEAGLGDGPRKRFEERLAAFAAQTRKREDKAAE